MVLPLKELNQLKSILKGKVSVEKGDLEHHTGDLWPRKLLLQRTGKGVEMPLAVVYPTLTQEIQTLLQWANSTKIPIIPFGGGSGVCGGASTTVDSIVVDLRSMHRIIEINKTSYYVTAEAGILGGDLEKELNREGFTLCHFPTSFFISTLGGWIATRASGQLSTAYGSIEDMLLALKVVLPNGSVLETKLVPRMSVGPSLQQLFLGSEGTLGIVTEASCQIQKFPSKMEFLSYSFDTLSDALFSIRMLIQKGIFPAVVRLYDEIDTQLGLGEIGIKEKGNLLVVILQGGDDHVAFQREMVQKIFPKTAKELGETPARNWWDHRFDLNEKKMTQLLSQKGMILDTIEVAATWSHLESLYDAIKKAIQSEVLVMAHFSHFYLTGGSIYFTFVGNVEEKEAIAKYDLVWKKAMEACLDSHGTISHHHGIGLLKKEWLKQELNGGWEILSQIKRSLDPHYILNPGKLV